MKTIIAGISVMFIMLIVGYILGKTFYPSGCCTSIGSYIILGVMFSGIPIGFYMAWRGLKTI